MKKKIFQLVTKYILRVFKVENLSG